MHASNLDVASLLKLQTSGLPPGPLQEWVDERIRRGRNPMMLVCAMRAVSNAPMLFHLMSAMEYTKELPVPHERQGQWERFWREPMLALKVLMEASPPGSPQWPGISWCDFELMHRVMGKQPEAMHSIADSFRKISSTVPLPELLLAARQQQLDQLRDAHDVLASTESDAVYPGEIPVDLRDPMLFLFNVVWRCKVELRKWPWELLQAAEQGDRTALLQVISLDQHARSIGSIASQYERLIRNSAPGEELDLIKRDANAKPKKFKAKKICAMLAGWAIDGSEMVNDTKPLQPEDLHSLYDAVAKQRGGLINEVVQELAVFRKMVDESRKEIPLRDLYFFRE